MILSQKVKDKYTYDDSKKFFHQMVKDDWKDRIELEVGDEKDSSKIQPQIKIKRWDNEVNASFRLKDFDNFTVDTDKEKIKLVNDKKEVHLYEIEPCEDHPEGGYEFDITLKEKPTSNVIEFSIETKELKFLYQPPLTDFLEIGDFNGKIANVTETEAFDTDGEVFEFSPENVIKSYAVYHKSKRDHILGDKNYKTGKSFHIYRPRIIDSDDNWVWGELSVDVDKKLLTVTIPQKFLDNAVYPVRHAAGATFGYNASPSSGTTMEDFVRGHSYTASSAGTIDSITATIDPQYSYKDFRFGVYDDDDDSRTAQTGNGVGITGKQQYELAVSGSPAITAKSYTLCAVGEAGSGNFYIYKDNEYPGYGKYDSLNYGPSTNLPNPVSWDGTGRSNELFAIYCTYTKSDPPAGPSIISWKTLLGVGHA